MVPKQTDIPLKLIEKMMQTVKTARFVLIFLLVAGIFSTAYLVQGTGDYSCASDQECNFIMAERKMMRSIEKKIRGRKMASEDYYLMKMDMMKENVERSKYTRKSRKNIEPKENYRASFVAFNADYKGPRRHPPKNN